MSDRIVHAVLRDGFEIVRYDRAGKWYVEAPDYPRLGSGTPRRPVSIGQAVAFATGTDARVFFGRQGGSRFDALVRKTRKGV